MGCPAAQKAESRASRSGTTPSPPPSREGGDLVLSLSSGLALLSLSLSLSARRPPNFLGLRRSTHFGLACGAEGRKQSKRIGDYPLLQGGGGDLVLSLSSGLALLLSRSPSRLLVGSSATKFSRPAASTQHPFLAGLRRRKGRKQSERIRDYPHTSFREGVI